MQAAHLQLFFLTGTQISVVSMTKNKRNTPGLRLDGHCVLDPLRERLVCSDGILLAALQGKHGGADGEQRTQREVLVFDVAAEDNAVVVGQQMLLVVRRDKETH